MSQTADSVGNDPPISLEDLPDYMVQEFVFSGPIQRTIRHAGEKTYCTYHDWFRTQKVLNLYRSHKMESCYWASFVR